MYNNANTQSSFTVNLCEGISLEGPWEVGLKEISIPNCWFNVTSPDNVILVTATYPVSAMQDKRKTTYVIDPARWVYRRAELEQIRKEAGTPPPGENAPDPRDRARRMRISDIRHTVRLTLPPGKYSAQSFVRFFNEKMNKVGSAYRKLFTQHVKALYDETTNKLGFQMQPGSFVVVTSTKLKQILGFGDTVLESSIGHPYTARTKRTVRPPRPCEFKLHVRHMYVYCSLVKHSQVGDVYSPILRVVNMDEKDKHTENVHREYLDTQYHEVRCGSFNQIEIQMRDPYGALPVFGRGNVLAVLHFRPRKLREK